MNRIPKPSRVVGAIAGVTAIPFVALAGLSVPLSGLAYLGFVFSSVLCLAFLAAFFFTVALPIAGRTKVGFCVAGAIAALATCVGYIALFSLFRSLAGGPSWSQTFGFYSGGSLVMFSPVLLVIGLLAGLIASSRRFAT